MDLRHTLTDYFQKLCTLLFQHRIMGSLHLCHQSIQFWNSLVIILPIGRNHSNQTDRVQRLIRLFILLEIIQVIPQILLKLHRCIKYGNLCLKEGFHILHSVLRIIQIIFPLKDTLDQCHVILLL